MFYLGIMIGLEVLPGLQPQTAIIEAIAWSKLKLKVTNPGMALTGDILQLRIVSQLESLEDLVLWWSMLE
jgi:hypothetical protein